jgi:hypothetical protein
MVSVSNLSRVLSKTALQPSGMGIVSSYFRVHHAALPKNAAHLPYAPIRKNCSDCHVCMICDLKFFGNKRTYDTRLSTENMVPGHTMPESLPDTPWVSPS